MWWCLYTKWIKSKLYKCRCILLSCLGGNNAYVDKGRHLRMQSWLYSWPNYLISNTRFEDIYALIGLGIAPFNLDPI